MALYSNLPSGGSSVIKSIQRYTTTMDAETCDYHINTVDISKTILIHCGNFPTNSSYDKSYFYECILELTDANTVTITRNTGSELAGCTVSFEVVEFN